MPADIQYGYRDRVTATVFAPAPLDTARMVAEKRADRYELMHRRVGVWQPGEPEASTADLAFLRAQLKRIAVRLHGEQLLMTSQLEINGSNRRIRLLSALSVDLGGEPITFKAG